MKKWILIAGILAAAAAPVIALSLTREIDPINGLNAARSETRLIVEIRDRSIPVSSLRSTYILIFLLNGFSFADRDKMPPIQARDFLSGEMFDAYEGAFVSGAGVIPKGSMKPYFLGFSTYEKAHEYVRENFKPGMRVVNFETATIEIRDELIAEGVLPPWMSEERVQLGERLVEQELKKGAELKAK